MSENETSQKEDDNGESTKYTYLYDFKEYKQMTDLIEQLPENSTDLRRRELANQQFKFICDTYQEQPHLIDPYLLSLCEKIIGVVKVAIRSPEKDGSNQELINEAFTYLHLLTKMRGHKRIVQYLPHETSDLEPVIRLLEQQNPNDVDMWPTRYMLLIWLSIVCMIPFDLTRFDDDTKGETIKSRLLNVCVPYLYSGGACQDASAFLLAKFMSRQDIRDSVLPKFFQQLLDSIDEAKKNGISIKLLGSLKCIACIFKYGKREDLLKYTAIALSSLVRHDLLSNQLAVIRKFYIKIIQRIGTTFFKIKVAKWRYERGSRVLMNLVNKSADNSSSSTSKQDQMDDDSDDSEQIPGEIEEIIEQLLSGLRDKDTIVRWSAAKGVGRITNRLGREPADDVLSSLLELFTFVEDDLAWHGGCLAIAELARRGLLLPAQLPQVVPIVLKALVFDKKLGNYSLGTNVRDSACYVCWAFARAFEPHIIAPFVNEIAARLLVVTVFDREINCRRAASAAFQENVGRQGQFPHGIDILTQCDYHAVGQIQSCYLSLSTFICAFEEYRQALIDHLLEHKFNHWDLNIRELTSQCLYNLTLLCPDYMAFCVLPKLLKLALSGLDLNTRHGTLISLGQLIHALCLIDENESNTTTLTRLFPIETMNQLKSVIDRIFDPKYFHGSGGELIRPAVCFFIKKLAMSNLISKRGDTELSTTFIRDCDDFITQCIEYNKESVQTAVVDAIPFYCDLKYRTLKIEPIEESKLVENFSKNFTETSKEYIRSGYSLALGNLPLYILSTNGNFSKCIQCLISTASFQKANTTTTSWVYARRDSIRALTNLYKLADNETTASTLGITASIIIDTIRCYLSSLDDYTLDSKGDSGCNVREAALEAVDSIVELYTSTSKQSQRLKDELWRNADDLKLNIFSGVIQQAVERIDRTRSIAGRVFSRLLYNPHLTANCEYTTHLRELFPQEACANMDWNSDHVTLPIFIHLLRTKEFVDSVLVGFIYSIGSLTESLRKAATNSFLKELKSIEKENSTQLKAITEKILALCRSNLKNDRLSSSLIRAVDLIIQDGLLGKFPELPSLFLNVFVENVSTTKDIQRLTSYVDLFCDMLQFHEGESSRVRTRSMQQLMIMLCHQYPRIRKATAQRLFEALITFTDMFESDEASDECMTLLSETDWDQSVEKIREIRNKLCDLTNTPKPVLKKAALAQKAPA